MKVTNDVYVARGVCDLESSSFVLFSFAHVIAYLFIYVPFHFKVGGDVVTSVEGLFFFVSSQLMFSKLYGISLVHFNDIPYLSLPYTIHYTGSPLVSSS